MTTPDLCLVVPCYNEAGRLDLGAFEQGLDAAPDLRLLFVDDGSRDDTAALLQAFALRRPGRSALLRLPVNLGKGEAVRLGLLQALDGEVSLVGFWDADLSTPLTLVPEFRRVLAARPDTGWVFGARWRGMGRRIERRATRHYVSRVFATAASLVLDLPVYDTQCGAKVFRADGLLRAVLERPFLTRWLFDVELLARLRVEHRAGRAGDPGTVVYEFPLAAWRHDTRSHLGGGDFLRAAWDLWRIRRHYRWR